MTINGTWGYKQKDQAWKSTHQLLHVLTDTASKGGNLLLNVGPTAEGEFPPATVDRLQAIGRWMKLNGEAIYATERRDRFNARCPGAARPKNTPRTVRQPFTSTSGTGQRTANSCSLPFRSKPVSGRVLTTGVPVTAENTADGVVVTLPGPCAGR